MSDILGAAAEALNEKLDGADFGGSVRFVIGDEGSVRIDETGAAVSDAEADCTLTASREVFEGMLSGEVNPTAAFMSGQLEVDGDMGLAMKLGALLA